MVAGWGFFAKSLTERDTISKRDVEFINCYSVNQTPPVFLSLAVSLYPGKRASFLYCLSDAYYTMQKSVKKNHHFYDDGNTIPGTELRINRMEFLRDTRHRRYHRRNDTSRDSAKKKIESESRRQSFLRLTYSYVISPRFRSL